MGWSDFEDDFSPYLDFEWYATDADGRVALLTSSGYGPVPLAVFQSRTAYETVRSFLLGLPVGSGSVVGPPPGSAWEKAAREAAGRGLYVYDWDACQGQPIPRRPYRLQATPSEPLQVEQLPVEVRGWLEAIRFVGVCFATSPELWPDQAFDQFEP